MSWGSGDLTADQKVYLTNTMPQCAVEGGSGQDGQAKAGGCLHWAPDIHRWAKSV